MKQQLDKALDHLILLHRIEEKQLPALGMGKILGFCMALAAMLYFAAHIEPHAPAVVTANADVSTRKLPIYCVQTDQPEIALTFDAAWGNEDTAEILSILKEQDVQATFFMTGNWVEHYPEDAKAILADGHDLGNHSESHQNMSQLTDSEKREELMSVHKKVQELTGYEMFLFRPPYGDYDNAVIKTAASCGYYSIQWDVDSLDWRDYGADSIISTVCEHSHLRNGSIILCHNGAKYTAEALEQMILSLKEKGFRLVPVSQLIYRDGYHMLPDGTQAPDLTDEPGNGS